MDHVVVAVARANLKLDVGHEWSHALERLVSAHGSATASRLAMMNLQWCLHLMSSHGSATATADASVMAASPFAVKLSVGAVGAVEVEAEAVGGGVALSQEVVLLVVVLSPASPSPGGGAVGGGAAACSPTVPQEEEEEVVHTWRGALGATTVPATASWAGAHETLGGSSRDTLSWRCSSWLTPSLARASRQGPGPGDLNRNRELAGPGDLNRTCAARRHEQQKNIDARDGGTCNETICTNGQHCKDSAGGV